MKTSAVSGLLLLFVLFVNAQAPSYEIGERFNDRYKYSTLLASAQTQNGKIFMVRKYFGGLPLQPKGVFIEVYDKQMQLLSDYNFKKPSKYMIDAWVAQGQLHILELTYNESRLAYEYIVHSSSVDHFGFKPKKLLSFPSKPVEDPLRAQRIKGKSNGSFNTQVLFDDSKQAFAIDIRFKKGKERGQMLYGFNADLSPIMEHDFKIPAEAKDYAFEYLAQKDGVCYLMGKAFFRKKRFDVKERRFQYELVRVAGDKTHFQSFSEAGKYPESLKPVLDGSALKTVGFYADRKDKRFNGLVYFELDPQDLSIKKTRYNAFSEQFMLDKFGRTDEAEIKNLVFKEVALSPDGGLLFSAEEFFVTETTEANSAGGRVKIERFHYNDIVCAKIDASGHMAWARNINKTEVTQGDGAYASYSTFAKDGRLYFFINSGENPQKLSNDRIQFKQGYSRNPNLFSINLDAQGKMEYRKLINDKEARIPLMVSKPLKTTDGLFFYAKRGSKKQLVQVAL
ncbi:hypothetical protein [Sediminicola luteus]|uniref:Uncharacterized protein n=1 Tax=Sediminicola luteus TaxID=319238 RepID=A0A2A4GEP3_9FLAO|nr:hypothetical protein [Sediminicola luteus]PCE66484.1 hypothetical protein B7P33_04090 [Sediminicola luteus]